MSKRAIYSARLFCGAAVFALISASGAQAQTAAAAPSNTLQEVVVTATRQTSTVNKVALSITATTQRQLDQQGVKTVQDFARATPSVVFTRAGTEGNPNISIRGISSTLGAPTTGVYLDDTPVQKRGTNGAVTGNGSPTPIIFDLDRIEVLRGPQGTPVRLGLGRRHGPLPHASAEPDQLFDLYPDGSFLHRSRRAQL